MARLSVHGIFLSAVFMFKKKDYPGNGTSNLNLYIPSRICLNFK